MLKTNPNNFGEDPMMMAPSLKMGWDTVLSKKDSHWGSKRRNNHVLVENDTCFQKKQLFWYPIFPRNIRAPAGMFDFRVWFGGMDRGYGSGYGSGVWIAARKTFRPALAGNWALSLSFTGPCTTNWASLTLATLGRSACIGYGSGMVRVWVGYDSRMIRVWFGHNSGLWQ